MLWQEFLSVTQANYRKVRRQQNIKCNARCIGTPKRQIGMILTCIIVMLSSTIVLGKKIEKSQMVAMFLVSMVMMCVKMRYECWQLRQLSQ